MQLTTEQLADGVERIALAGRLDTPGAQQIDLRFTALTATRPALIVVDLSEVSFLASMGIRTLLMGAKALKKRGGRMAVAAPQPFVYEILKVAAVDSILPIYDDVQAARAALAAGGHAE